MILNQNQIIPTNLLVEAYKRNYFDSAIADVYRAIRGGSLMGGFTLLFCIIDSLAIIENGDKNNAYNNWINKWLLPHNIFYSEKDKYLYAARCSLIHTYGVSNSQAKHKLGIRFSHREIGMHLQFINREPENLISFPNYYGGFLIINLPDLLAEVTVGANYFFDWLKECETIESKIIKRLCNLLQVHFSTDSTIEEINSMIKKPYFSMDKALAILDGTPYPKKDALLIDIFEIETLG